MTYQEPDWKAMYMTLLTGIDRAISRIDERAVPMAISLELQQVLQDAEEVYLDTTEPEAEAEAPVPEGSRENDGEAQANCSAG